MHCVFCRRVIFYAFDILIPLEEPPHLTADIHFNSNQASFNPAQTASGTVLCRLSSFLSVIVLLEINGDGLVRMNRRRQGA